MQWASICEAVSTPLWKSASVPKHLNLLSSAKALGLGKPSTLPQKSTSLPDLDVLAKSEAAFEVGGVKPKFCPTTLQEKVLHELLSTERIYVHHLKDIIEVCYCLLTMGNISCTHDTMQGYLVKCRQHTMLFREDISTIFSNIEEIYRLHVKILSEFEQQRCSIGEVFIKNVSLNELQ